MGLLDCTITVDSTPRTYKEAYVAKYAKQLASQNTKTAKADITDATLGAGKSYLRLSHEEVGGVQRHLVSIEDVYQHPTDPDKDIVDKSHTVISCESDDPNAEIRVENLDDGLDAWLATAGLKASIVNSEF